VGLNLNLKVMSDNRLPITRLSKFFSEDDFNLHIQMGEEYLHGDLNMKLVLYRVDRTKTDKDDVYGEVGQDEIKYLPPVEFNGLVKIEDAKNSSYKTGYLRYLEPGNLSISVYIKHLDDLKIDIRFGDYIGYPESESKVRYYTVSNDGKVVADNRHKQFGYKPHYRTIICVPTQENDFRGI
jgi:hypothetical protein